MTSAREIFQVLGGRSGLAYCPAHPNTKTPALSIRDGSDGKLLVHCFADCTGADVLAALRARGLLAGNSDWKPDPREIERRRANKAVEDLRRIDQARRCWAEAGPISGTLAERYLRARGITCRLSTALRYHPHCWHRDTAAKLPALVAAVVIDRELAGVHRTYLAEPGVKAFDTHAKMMLGRCAGGAVRITDGPGILLVAEGIETALSLQSGLPVSRPRVWAALSTSGVAGLILPRQPGELVLAPDGDEPGREAARKLVDRARTAGWKVRTMKIDDGKDWNDMLVEEMAL